MVEEIIIERYELVKLRLEQIEREDILEEPLLSYFKKVASFAYRLSNILDRSISNNVDNLSEEELKAENHWLYEDILPNNYDESYGNPEYITSVIKGANVDDDELMAKCLCFLYSEIRGLIPAAYEGDIEIYTLYVELFLEIYSSFSMGTIEGELPKAQNIKEIIYWFESDNCDIVVPKRIREQLDPDNSFARDIIMNSDINNTRYLYLYGEYVSEDEIETAKFLSSLSEDEIMSMASTFTEGYRIGFVKAGKPLNKKKTVNIRYSLGFERITRYAIKNFESIGLKPTIYRAGSVCLNKRGVHKIGYVGANPNRQYDFDHKDDEALFLDAEFVTRKIDVLRDSYESMKLLANTHGGPACQEVFGENVFTPVAKTSAISHNDKTRKLKVDYESRSSQIVNEYIIGEERSFTIIAYPIPSIGDKYKEIFKETVKLNTLDYKLYEDMQQIIIDVLDKAEYVHVTGKGDNKTDINISLVKLSDPGKETKFENCVADVNIPVGEVFTSPVLKKTDGLLHVTGVYLNELYFKNLKLTLKDGMVTDYSVSNFDNEEENRKFVKDNLLFNHSTLPIGEFAIGTNTVAYKMTRDYNIADKLPILIGEKTGPHFAFGDTCYSHEEEVRVYNPDGKEIIAKENEVSKLRNTDIKKAYFQCHTDVTIPYDELGEIVAVTKNGNIPIFENGIFVLSGLEELNKPLKQ